MKKVCCFSQRVHLNLVTNKLLWFLIRWNFSIFWTVVKFINFPNTVINSSCNVDTGETAYTMIKLVQIWIMPQTSRYRIPITILKAVILRNSHSSEWCIIILTKCALQMHFIPYFPQVILLGGKSCGLIFVCLLRIILTVPGTFCIHIYYTFSHTVIISSIVITDRVN